MFPSSVTSQAYVTNVTKILLRRCLLSKTAPSNFCTIKRTESLVPRLFKKFSIFHIFDTRKRIEVWVTNDSAIVEQWISRHVYVHSEIAVESVGFDCEWRPGSKTSRSKVSTIQIATDNAALVIQVAYIDKIPAELSRLVSCQKIRKVGIGIADDLMKLKHE